MNFKKFISMLDRSSLIFTRLDALEDAYEGRLTLGDYKLMEKITNSGFDDYEKVGRKMTKILNMNIDLIRSGIYVNCWHENVNETVFMWSHYAPHGDGIAIKTDFQSLQNSIADEGVVQFGRMKYFVNTDASMLQDDRTVPWLIKRKEFEAEKEVRAYFTDYLGAFSVASNVALEVNVPVLVSEIIVDPSAPDWVVGLVESVASKYDLDKPVTHSSLATEPYS